MSTRTIKILKVVVFLIALAPFAVLVKRFMAQDLTADPVQFITHFTGNWAMYFLLGSLAITPVRRFSPKLAWLIRFRRMLGLYAFFYATLHLLTYVFLFSGFDLTGALTALRAGQFHVLKEDWIAVWPTITDDVAKRRFVQVGLASYVILLALALTSPQWVLRKMGGKPWQLLHRTVYIAAFLSIVHYWWLVKKGNNEPATVTIIFWVLMFARIGYVLWKKRPQPARA